VNPSGLTVAVGVLLLVVIAAYALFAGADFGGGIWDLLAGGDLRGATPRAAIDASVTPVWEGNHVWLIFGLVVLWTGFPTAFSAVMIALFVPIAISLLGIVLRGVGFAFRHESQRLPTQRLYGAMFAAASLMTPFFLGACVGAVATGRVPVRPTGNVWSAWTSPTAVVTGLLFVSACAYIGGAYLVADSAQRGQAGLTRYFRARTLGAGLVTGVLAGVNLVLLHGSAPRLWHRLFGPALPAVVVSVVAGVAALVFLLGIRRNLLRGAAALAVVGVVAGWGVAQYPYALPGTLTLGAAAGPPASQIAVFVAAGLAVLFVLPGFVWLYWLQQHGELEEPEEPLGVEEAAGTDDGRSVSTTRAPEASPGRSVRVVETVVVAAAVTDLARDALRRLIRGGK
jgi:cytochrome bd ubiquinol oxidase subunit II